MSDLTHGRRAREREHEWIEYDDSHRACRHCGLRLFYSQGAYGRRGWLLLNYFGVLQPLHMIGTDAGDSLSFGTCTLPVQPPIAESVIIDYTGDPDVHPECERFMHRVPPSSGAALLDVRSLVPACGFRPTWWELGPARVHDGWTWCADCWGSAWGGKQRQKEVRAWRVQPRPRALLK